MDEYYELIQEEERVTAFLLPTLYFYLCDSFIRAIRVLVFLV